MTTALKRTALLLWMAAAAMVIASAAAEDCGHEEFAKCAKPLGILQLTSEFPISAAKREELNKTCVELRTGLRCIQSYTRRCMALEQRKEFNKLYHGTNQFVRDLCNQGEFQEEYLKHSACSKLAKPDFEVCANRYKDAIVFITPSRPQENISMSDNIKKICCSLNELVDCLENGAKEKCGADAARFTRELIEKFVNSLTKTYCESYVSDRNKCINGKSDAQPLIVGFVFTLTVVLAPIVAPLLMDLR